MSTAERFNPEETQSDLGPAIDEAYKMAGLPRPEAEEPAEHIPTLQPEPEERPVFVEPDKAQEIDADIDPNSEAILGEEAVRLARAAKEKRREIKQLQKAAASGGPGSYPAHAGLRYKNAELGELNRRAREERARDLGEVHPAEFLRRSVFEHATAALKDKAFLQSLHEHNEAVDRLTPSQLAERYTRYQELLKRDRGARHSAPDARRANEALGSLVNDMPPELLNALGKGSEVIQRQAVWLGERLRASKERARKLEEQLQLRERIASAPRRLTSSAGMFFGSMLEGIKSRTKRGTAGALNRLRQPFTALRRRRHQAEPEAEQVQAVRHVAVALSGDSPADIEEKRKAIDLVAAKEEERVASEAAWTKQQQEAAHKRLKMLMSRERLSRLRDAQVYYEAEIMKHPGIFKQFLPRTSKRPLTEAETQLELDYVVAATINTKMDALIEEGHLDEKNYQSKLKNTLTPFFKRRQLGSKSPEEIRSFFKKVFTAKAEELEERMIHAEAGEREVLSWKKTALEEIIQELSSKNYLHDKV